MTHLLAFAAGCAAYHFAPALWAKYGPKVRDLFNVPPLP